MAVRTVNSAARTTGARAQVSSPFDDEITVQKGETEAVDMDAVRHFEEHSAH